MPRHKRNTAIRKKRFIMALPKVFAPQIATCSAYPIGTAHAQIRKLASIGHYEELVADERTADPVNA